MAENLLHLKLNFYFRRDHNFINTCDQIVGMKNKKNKKERRYSLQFPEMLTAFSTT